eukprot:8938373-Pyramimonas_sp.AAC.1
MARWLHSSFERTWRMTGSALRLEKSRDGVAWISTTPATRSKNASCSGGSGEVKARKECTVQLAVGQP